MTGYHIHVSQQTDHPVCRRMRKQICRSELKMPLVGLEGFEGIKPTSCELGVCVRVYVRLVKTPVAYNMESLAH